MLIESCHLTNFFGIFNIHCPYISHFHTLINFQSSASKVNYQNSINLRAKYFNLWFWLEPPCRQSNWSIGLSFIRQQIWVLIHLIIFFNEHIHWTYNYIHNLSSSFKCAHYNAKFLRIFFILPMLWTIEYYYFFKSLNFRKRLKLILLWLKMPLTFAARSFE